MIEQPRNGGIRSSKEGRRNKTGIKRKLRRKKIRDFRKAKEDRETYHSCCWDGGDS
jgi:hypothetical protein